MINDFLFLVDFQIHTSLVNGRPGVIDGSDILRVSSVSSAKQLPEYLMIDNNIIII